jgi:hypothetical protein
MKKTEANIKKCRLSFKGIVSRKFAMLFIGTVGKLKLFLTFFTLTIFKNIVVFMSNFRRKDVRRQFFE